MPEGVRFADDPLAPGVGVGPYETIVFRPDGTALLIGPDGLERLETQVYLTDTRGQYMVLHLRALTGVITVGTLRAP